MTLKIKNIFFLPNTPYPDNTPPYHVWLKMVEQFRRYHPDKIRHMDRVTDGQMYRQTDLHRQSDSKDCAIYAKGAKPYRIPVSFVFIEQII